jgi:hypothetical protein
MSRKYDHFGNLKQPIKTEFSNMMIDVVIPFLECFCLCMSINRISSLFAHLLLKICNTLLLIYFASPCLGTSAF